MAEKVNSLLASLRGEEPSPAAEDAPPPMEMGGTVGEAALTPLKEQIAALEAKVEELKPPPPEERPPEAPTELTVWMHTRLELLEKKLETAQQEALRSNLLLREREEAQRKAQTEVEDLFRSIKEANRAQTYDKELRDNYQSSQRRMKELQQRLQLAELRMIPAEEVMRHMTSEEGREMLAARIKEQLAEIESSAEEHSAPPPAPSAGSAPPEPEAARSSEFLTAVEAKAFVDEKIALLLGRISDLEHRLHEGERLHREKEAKRREWETDIILALKTTRRQWQKSGGPDILVEAALETLVDTLHKRDELHAEMARLVACLQDEPPESDATPKMRAQLLTCQKGVRDTQNDIDKQMALVQAWIARNKGT